MFCLLRAYEAVLDADGRPPLNVHFIFEGEEECGGHVIDDLLHGSRSAPRPMRCWSATCRYYAPGMPAVYTALRGMCYAEITVRTLQRDLHSGTYGGVAPNAIETLVRLLTDLKDADGGIQIPKLYKSVKPPTKAELRDWKRLPFNKKEFLEDEVTGKALTGLKKYSVFERTWALPTFEIHGIRGGFVGEGAKTVIPAAATAKVSLRLVPGLPFEQVAQVAGAGGQGGRAQVGRRGGQDAPRRRSGPGRRRAPGVRGAGRRPSRKWWGGRRCGSAPAARFRSCPDSGPWGRR